MVIFFIVRFLNIGIVRRLLRWKLCKSCVFFMNSIVIYLWILVIIISFFKLIDFVVWLVGCIFIFGIIFFCKIVFFLWNGML